jgi:predicted hotdog family 3-hydroxylacyl-ACP dehydratase
MTGHAPVTLDHAGIASRVPHRGAMCLLERLVRWDDEAIECTVTNHGDAQHPLRLREAEGDLGAACAIEYAAQAMALHAALHAGEGAPPVPGFLASARDVQMTVARLDDAPGPLTVRAHRQAGDARQAMYRFTLHDTNGRLLVSGRTTVVLEPAVPLEAPAARGLPRAADGR